MRYNKRKPRCEAGSPMKKVKITMRKTTLDEELAKEYGVEGLTACPMFRQGQTFYADYAKPEGLCDEASSIHMCLRWPTGRKRNSSIPGTLEARRGHLQLQRRSPPRDFQAGGNGGTRSAGLHAGALNGFSRDGKELCVCRCSALF